MKTTRKVDKREQHIKKKLTAAILMLLISSIMTITSTYAWFTLSTAPEVTGIQTTIGGNGNLEIALATGETWNDPTKVQTLSATVADVKITNASWGNLIDVSPSATDDPYGINKLVLAPARLAATYTNMTDLLNGSVETASILKAPKYGADGRVSELQASMTAVFDGESFTMGNTDYGVRAIGISTAMTARQNAFMTARSTVTSSANAAKNGTSAAMNKNGGMLGNLAVTLATASNRDDVSFTNTEYLAIKELITETEAAATKIDEAIIALIDAFMASGDMQYTESNQNGIDDITYTAIKNALSTMKVFDGDDTRADDITVVDNTITFKYADGESTITKSIENEAVAQMISKYISIRTNLKAAIDSLPDYVAGDAQRYYWGVKADRNTKGLSTAVSMLMNMDGNITVAGKTIDELKDIINNVVMSELMAIANNLNVNLGSGSGVYYDIASLVGSIQANILIDITYNGITMEDTPATISSKFDKPVIPLAMSVLTSPSAEGSAEASRISDIYGYAIDLLFRTNAADSSLMLQTTPVDRIYSDNANEDTMGGGSTMTFTKTVSSFTDAQMLNLMNSIKIVFMDDAGDILAIAGLDTGSTTTTTYYTDENHTTVSELPTDYFVTETIPHYVVNEAEGSITVDIRLIHKIDLVNRTVQFISDDMEEVVKTVKTIYYTDSSKSEISETETEWFDTETTESTVTVEPEICKMTQNVAKKLSVVVYLDGDTVTNADVANAATSMTGTMNLQFASNADLTPMEYSGLHVTNPAAPTPTPGD